MQEPCILKDVQQKVGFTSEVAWRDNSEKVSYTHRMANKILQW